MEYKGYLAHKEQVNPVKYRPYGTMPFRLKGRHLGLAGSLFSRCSGTNPGAHREHPKVVKNIVQYRLGGARGTLIFPLTALARTRSRVAANGRGNSRR